MYRILCIEYYALCIEYYADIKLKQLSRLGAILQFFHVSDHLEQFVGYNFVLQQIIYSDGWENSMKMINFCFESIPQDVDGALYAVITQSDQNSISWKILLVPNSMTIVQEHQDKSGRSVLLIPLSTVESQEAGGRLLYICAPNISTKKSFRFFLINLSSADSFRYSKDLWKNTKENISFKFFTSKLLLD